MTLEKVSFVIFNIKFDIFSNNLFFLKTLSKRYTCFDTKVSNEFTETKIWIINFVNSTKSYPDKLIGLKILKILQEKYNFIYAYPSSEINDTLLGILNVVCSKSDLNESTLEVNNYDFKLRFLSFNDFIGYLNELILKQLIEKNSKTHIFLHAGAVCKNNKATIFPGPSHIGKTTTVLALLKKGYQFLADDITIIDLYNHYVLPFPRGLTIRADSPYISALPKEVFTEIKTEVIVDIREMEPNSLGSSSMLDNIIFLKGYLPEQNNACEITKIPLHKAVTELCKNNILIDNNFQVKLDRSISLIKHVQCYELKTGNLSLTSNLICNVLDGGYYD
jgi:Serine kinase of the HPr protein, regulates carbohydrate metabolism